MKPLFFGDAEEPLFGIYTPSRGVVGRKGVVLCPPIGQEGLVSHRSLRILAEKLADAGLDVLRFDYYGTGDSAGDNHAGSVSRWLEDVRLAVDTLRELSGVRRVALVGLRLGGLLAACAEARSISELILWDPVTRGADYLQELENAADTRRDDWEVLGFPFSAHLRDELRNLQLTATKRLARDVRFVVGGSANRLEGLQRELEGRRIRVEVERIDSPPVWIEERALGLGALPVGVFRQIVAWAQ